MECADLPKTQLKLLRFTAKSLHRARFDANALAVLRSAVDMEPELSPKYQRLFLDVVRANLNPIRGLLCHCQEAVIRESRDRRSVVPITVQDIRRTVHQT
jgi:hypothetical protein